MEKNKAMFTSIKQDWATPKLQFKKWNNLWKFTLDACADEKNTCCNRYYSKEQNGLLQSWTNERVWCNPPYNEIKEWLNKAYAEIENNALSVLPIPFRGGTKWYNDLVRGKALEIPIIGRLTFGSDEYWEQFWKENPDKFGKKAPAPFDSVLVVFHKDILTTTNK